MSKTQIMQWLSDAIDRSIINTALEQAPAHVVTDRLDGKFKLEINTENVFVGDEVVMPAAHVFIVVEVFREVRRERVD